MAREYSNRAMWEFFIVHSRLLLGLSIKCPSTPKKWAPCSYWYRGILTRRIIGVARSISTLFETIKSKFGRVVPSKEQQLLSLHLLAMYHNEWKPNMSLPSSREHVLNKTIALIALLTKPMLNHSSQWGGNHFFLISISVHTHAFHSYILEAHPQLFVLACHLLWAFRATWDFYLKPCCK